MGALFVLGSINQDFVLRLERRPEPGETVTNAELSLFPGGKGANGAIAAARLGAEVAMLGRVGEDAFGAELVENLHVNGVGTEHVETVESAARIATDAGGRLLLNLAPPRHLPGDLLRRCDPLVVNEHEARFLLG